MSGICIFQMIFVCLRDFNEHVGKHIVRFNGGYGVRQRNLEGGMLLVMSGEGIMCVRYMVYEREDEGDSQSG